MLCFCFLQLGLHWRLNKQWCDSNSMMEYVSFVSSNKIKFCKVLNLHIEYQYTVNV